MARDVHAYCFNHETFAFESFDEEIVVLNLVSGAYYAFGGAAVSAWPHIIGQHSEPAIASALASRYGVETNVIRAELSEFLERLLSAKILLTAAENATEIDCSPLGPSSKYPGFHFEHHDDMADLLTLDPIHDVDPRRGWPTA